MGQHRIRGDMLGTMERCLASVRNQADALGIAIELLIPVNPGLLDLDTSALDRLAYLLLCYALSEAVPGGRLCVRLDLAPDDGVRLAIDEENGRQRPRRRVIRAASRKASVAPARAIVQAAGGHLSVTQNGAGRVHVSATLPRAARKAAHAPSP